MVNIAVTFVIPAYNCAPYIGRTVESIFRQGLTSFEILIVDDCSTDNTLEVVNELALLHSCVRVICHEVNRAQGAARNTGIAAARGEFVYFIDADDWLSDGGVSVLLNMAKARELDVVACGVQTVNESGDENLYHACDFESSGGAEGVDHFSQYRIGAIACDKLYRKSFLNNHGIRFVEGYFHEDIIFTAAIALECVRYFSTSMIYVNYFQNNASTCNAVPTRRHLASYLNIYIWMQGYFEELASRGIDNADLIKRLARNYGFAEVFPKLKRYAATRSRSVFVEDVYAVVCDRIGPGGAGIADLVCGFFENYALED